MNVLHLVGPPGAGKSTLVEAMTAGLDVAEFRFQQTPMYWLQYQPGGVAEIGRPATEEKPRRGSDRLTMNVIEYAWPWIQAHRPEHVLIEGARIEARSWYHAVRGLGYEYRVVYVHAPQEVRLARLGGRDGAQDPKWMAGRESGAERFASETGAYRLLSHSIPEMVAELEARSDVAALLGVARNRLNQWAHRTRETPPKQITEPAAAAPALPQQELSL